MIRGTCAQADADLAALAAGSPCAAMAEAALKHEARHRARCLTIGPRPYWERPASQIAPEEAGDYKEQGADLRAELRRVLDVSDVRLTASFHPTLSVPKAGMTAVYRHQASTGDIGQPRGGPERWTMTGRAT